MRSIHATVLVAGLSAVSVSHAQGLPDPTRPPAILESPVVAAGAPPARILQSIVRRQGDKPAAVIGGQIVRIGEKIGEARLVAVNEDSVVIEGESGREMLYLTPSAQKRQNGTSAATADGDGDGKGGLPRPPRPAKREAK